MFKNIAELSEIDITDKLAAKDPLSVVIFYAKWSGNSQLLNSSLEKLDLYHLRILSFYKVDIEKCPDLKNNFGITELPTVLFYSGGWIKGKLHGPINQTILMNRITNCLEQIEN